MCYQITPTVVIRFRLGLERMPHANGGTPVFIQVAAARAFDVAQKYVLSERLKLVPRPYSPHVLGSHRSWSRIRSRA